MTARLDPRLRNFASDMRNQPTPIEAALWRKLSNSKLGGFKFRRQTVIGAYIADFFCPAIGLVVELDGRTHEEHYDARRDAVMREQGFQVLRFSNQELGRNMEGVLTTILGAAQARPNRFTSPPLQERGERRAARGPGVGPRPAKEEHSAAPSFPTPSPSPEGEGSRT